MASEQSKWCVFCDQSSESTVVHCGTRNAGARARWAVNTYQTYALVCSSYGKHLLASIRHLLRFLHSACRKRCSSTSGQEHNHSLSEQNRADTKSEFKCSAWRVLRSASHLCFKPSHKCPRRHDYDPWSGIRRGAARSPRLCCGSRTNRHGNHDNPKDD
jgi:hypothetical protein